MLDTATVTLSYKEFKELIDKAELVEVKEKSINKLIKEREEKEEREEGKLLKTLDTITDLLIKALQSRGKNKQECIKKAIECYCNAFGIPVKEFMMKMEE